MFAPGSVQEGLDRSLDGEKFDSPDGYRFAQIRSPKDREAPVAG